MRKKSFVALAGLVLAAAIGVPSAAVAGVDDNQTQQNCAAEFDAAVREDNTAYNERDAARYEAVLNPRMIYAYDGTVIYGRDNIMDGARQAFAVPGWIWTWTIESETVYGCHSGIAVMQAHTIKPGQNYDHHFAITMTMVREGGKWTVAMDTIHLLPA